MSQDISYFRATIRRRVRPREIKIGNAFVSNGYARSSSLSECFLWLLLLDPTSDWPVTEIQRRSFLSNNRTSNKPVERVSIVDSGSPVSFSQTLTHPWTIGSLSGRLPRTGSMNNLILWAIDASAFLSHFDRSTVIEKGRAFQLYNHFRIGNFSRRFPGRRRK